ncbi:MAG: Maf family protein [bacterium]
MQNIEKLIKLNKPLILASKSPRRRKLLASLGFEFEVMESYFKEDKINNIYDFKQYAINSAYNKANDVATRIEKPAIVLGADTIVVLNNEILHKPKDKTEAFTILQRLSDNTHFVYTGIALIDTLQNISISDVRTTEVTFRKLDENEIWAYIATNSPMDKAGAYGIQDDFGAVFVKHINGCYYNIVGLPLEMFYNMLKRLGNNG